MISSAQKLSKPMDFKQSIDNSQTRTTNGKKHFLSNFSYSFGAKKSCEAK